MEKRNKCLKKNIQKKKGGHPNNPNNNNWEAPPTISMNNLQKNSVKNPIVQTQTEVSNNFKEFKKKLNKLRNDERHASQSESRNELKQIEENINDLKKKNPQFTLDYFRNLSAKAELNKKATAAKQAEFNAKTREYIEKNGTGTIPQSSRTGNNGPALGNKVPSYISPFAKRNKRGKYIDPNTGILYPGQ